MEKTDLNKSEKRLLNNQSRPKQIGSKSNFKNKREIILSLIYENLKTDYVPGAFFMHFGNGNFFGESAVNNHLGFFRNADLDILKIQYEQKYPVVHEIQKPKDWKEIPFFKKDFYADQLKVVKALVKKGKKDALVLATVYSPLQFASQVTGKKHHVNHLNEDPELVKKGLEIINQSTLIYVKECMKLGVDGFFQVTQGGESNRFVSDSVFENYIKPFDLIIGQEISTGYQCNILHIHTTIGKYKNYSAFKDYPGHIVNCEFELENGPISINELYKLFDRPIMGGLSRNGIIVDGTKDEIYNSVRKVISKAPEKFLIGANCTIPSHTKWDNVKVAMDAAHNFFKNDRRCS